MLPEASAPVNNSPAGGAPRVREAPRSRLTPGDGTCEKPGETRREAQMAQDQRQDEGRAASSGAGFLRLSLVTPNFNGAAFIGETLKSVAAQNYPNLDHIVVDGASSDASLEIVGRYRDRLSALISEPDRGHADAVNKGFAASDGEILGWINSDDILLPGALRFVNRVFRERPDIEWITGRPSSMDEDGNIGWVGPVRPWSRLRFLSGDNKWIQQESTFWRRSLWERAGGKLDLRYCVANDFDLWARFFRHAELHTVNRFLGCFRIREGQRSIAFKSLYETEIDSILREQYITLEPEFRAAFEPLLPASTTRLKPATQIAADPRYAIGDPAVLSSAEALGWSGAPPRRAAPMPIGTAFAADDISRFKDIHKGKRCFIMGNGPSLNRMDLSRLAGETVFACNAAFLLFDRISWRPRYYVCVDSRVLPDRAAEIDVMLTENPGMQGFFPAFLQEHTGAKFRRATRAILPPGPNRNFFNERANSTDDPPRSMFSLDANEAVIQPYTVAITMMQLAAYMGFTEIVLIGCDTNYVVPATVRRGGDDDPGGLALTSERDDDANHFDPRYFGKDRKWHDPQPEMMIRHHQYAKEALDAIGVKVFNATVGGKLEVFPRRAFESLTRPAADAVAGAPSAPVGKGGDMVLKRTLKSLRRNGEAAASILWRARLPIAAAAAVAGALMLASALPVFAPVRPMAFAAAGFVFLLGLIAATALRLRSFIVELSRQLLELSNGAAKPDAESLLARLAMEDEIARLREEVEALKAEIGRPKSGG